MRQFSRCVPRATALLGFLCLLAAGRPAESQTQSRAASATLAATAQILPESAVIGGYSVSPEATADAGVASYLAVFGASNYRVQVSSGEDSTPRIVRRGAGPARLDWTALLKEVELATPPADGRPAVLQVVLEALT